MDKNVGINIRGAAGVSIVEIMISLVLVAIALIAVTTVFPNITRHRKGIYETEQAQLIAEEALEYLQSLQYYEEYTCNDFNGGNGAADFNAKYGPQHLKDLGSAAKCTVSVAGTPLCSGDIKTISVRVGWRKSGKDHKITVTGALL
jgi:type II secretory pathway pseudopilin PulG